MFASRFVVVIGSVIALFCPGCGGGSSDSTDIAKAMSYEGKHERAAKDLDQKEAAQRKAEATQQKQTQSRLEAAVEAAAVLPQPMPADLAAACDAVVDAYDGFMKQAEGSELDGWHDGRRKKLGKRRTACATVGNLQVAACEAQILTHPPQELGDGDRVERARRLMEACAAKFGGA